MKTKTLILQVLIALLVFFTTSQPIAVQAQFEDAASSYVYALSALEDHFTFMIGSDFGRNGYYDQKPVAEMMGEVAAITDPEFVAALGDVHHFMGVRSVHDPLWNTNYEWIYKHPELMIPWYPVLGNHEYRGSTQAVLDYSGISRRWEMPHRYYDVTWPVSENVAVLLLFIDTTPLIDKYINNPEEYADASKQSMKKQLAWIDAVLEKSDARWKIVMGHHPVFAGTTKVETERSDLQNRLQPLLDKHDVDVSVCGHIHNFQHIRAPESNVDYFVNSSASLSREVVDIEGALFASPDPGFALCTVKEGELIMTFVNKEGDIIYQHIRRKSAEN
jgi:hypothetical protein